MNSRRSFCVAGAVCLFGVCGAFEARADVLIGNMPGNDGTQSAALQNGRIKAMGFTMPGNDAELGTVTLRLQFTGTDVIPQVRIFDDAFGAVGSELLTLDNPAVINVGTDNYEFTPPSPFTLQANATYWLVVYNIGGSSMSWPANSPAIIPTGLATHAGSLFSASGGPNPPTGTSAIMNSYEISTGGPTCRPDLNGDGVVDADDFFLFLQYFADGDPRADFNNDGVIDADDFFIFLNEFAQGC
ncbi:MAG: dockerin type I repeat-containing protein [Phycisphaerales bacterium]|nr:dockerin type I repeat-containing protein [Phycisphaerales bacterium]